MTNSQCENCRFYVPDLATTGGECRRYPIAQKVPPAYWCGEFKDRMYAENGAIEKVSDQELFEAIRYFPGQVVPWKLGLDTIAAQFGISRRTLEERVKRLDWLQKVEIVRTGNGRIDSVMPHLSMIDWDGWVASCAQFGGKPEVRWKEMEEKGVLLPGATRPARSNAKWDYGTHLLPTMQQCAPSEDRAEKFSKLANAAHSLCGINRAAFARLIRESLERGAIGQTAAGLYYLKGA